MGVCDVSNVTMSFMGTQPIELTVIPKLPVVTSRLYPEVMCQQRLAAISGILATRVYWLSPCLWCKNGAAPHCWHGCPRPVQQHRDHSAWLPPGPL